jgi:hypothetical protein
VAAALPPPSRFDWKAAALARASPDERRRSPSPLYCEARS